MRRKRRNIFKKCVWQVAEVRINCRRRGGGQFNFESCEGSSHYLSWKKTITATPEEQQETATVSNNNSNRNRANSCKAHCPAAILLISSSSYTRPFFWRNCYLSYFYHRLLYYWYFLNVYLLIPLLWRCMRFLPFFLLFAFFTILHT